jgi:L-histidine Nalpha-methyltransferase
MTDTALRRTHADEGVGGPSVSNARESMLREIRDGMSRPQKELSPKYFYDHRGSELFERITELPEYYLTRTERVLLERWIPDWITELRPATLVELGAGSAEKTRILLDAMVRERGDAVYVPVDVSADFLRATAARLRESYPGLEVRPAIADISEEFDLAAGEAAPVLHAFLGSTIGNFAPQPAIRLLRTVRRGMEADDRFLLGVDLRKDVETIEAAYNDAAGITAEFNRNMLCVLNDRTGADFEPDLFEHRAFYNREEHRIEMHLVADRAHSVTVPGAGTWMFEAGETIRTEISCKHDRRSMESMLRAAGLEIDRWETDPDERYAVLLARPSA